MSVSSLGSEVGAALASSLGGVIGGAVGAAGAAEAAAQQIGTSVGEALPTGDVIVICGKPARAFGGWYTDESPSISGGYGGYQSTLRPKRAPLTDWQGRDLFILTVPLILSRGGKSIHDDRAALDALATGTRHNPPPPVKVFGVPEPVGASGSWVIQDPGWGDLLRRSDGALYRQFVTLTLLEYIDETLLQASTQDSRVNGHVVVEHYTVTKHDLSLKSSALQHIAAKTLGDGTRWPDIAVLNNLRSSGQLKLGQLLKLP